MPQKLIKTLAYLILILGIILSLSFLAGAVALLFVLMPEAILWKKVALGASGIMLAVITLLVSLGIFEYLLTFIKMEQGIEKIEEEVKGEERGLG